MLQWEIDRSLTELTELYGLDKAADIYRRSYAATADLCDYIQALGISCLFPDGPASTWVAAIPA